MKRVLSYLLLALLAFSSCRKDNNDSVFSGTTDERINKVLGDYQAALAGAQYGWNARLETAAGSVYNFHFSFNDANRVLMYGDIDTLTASERKESSYRLKALQQPALLFDTYSYIHILADPDGGVNGGEYGEGLHSDFEFSLDSLAADSIKLTGRFKGSKMVLKRASQQDLQMWQNGQWKNVLLFEDLGSRILNYFKRLNYGGTQYEIQVNGVERTVTFTWKDAGGAAHQHTTGYIVNGTGIQLTTPLVDGANTISSFSNFSWNTGTSSFTMNVNGTTPSAIVGAIAPVVVDLEGPRRWWNFMAQQDGYWATVNGFHVNGVDDAFGLRGIPDFMFLVFWPRFGTDAGVTYDLAGWVHNLGGTPTIMFGAAFEPPQFSTNGRVVFPYYGTLGEVPPEAEDPYVNTAVQFIDPLGYYLVQTSASTYDMVSVRDAKAWITWEY
ncbi:DUF4302 domain-containing protein [Chitinophaga barathri]|nr:DUF4302 domain-containing protein [Chitinophaga barathri]